MGRRCFLNSGLGVEHVLVQRDVDLRRLGFDFADGGSIGILDKRHRVLRNEDGSWPRTVFICDDVEVLDENMFWGAEQLR